MNRKDEYNLLIQVHNPEKRFDYVNGRMLQWMIDVGMIDMFKRSTEAEEQK